jgi:hypothetical protein
MNIAAAPALMSDLQMMIADGFVKMTPPEHFNAENLYIIKINGKAELYLSAGFVELTTLRMADAADILLIQIRLQQPYVDIEKRTGCGICEHECVVSGKRAIRISGYGETRSTDRKLLLEG